MSYADDLAAFRAAVDTPDLNGSAPKLEERHSRTGDVTGGAFVLDAPTQIEAVWGSHSSVLWAEGEPTMIYGPDGVGKTTLAQQLVLRRIGIGPPELLGHSVAPGKGKVLYLALDRPQQAARSMRRMANDQDRQTLDNRLRVWRGSVPFDVVREPGSLMKFARERGADTIVIDSLKDLVPKLSDEDTGTATHRAWQLCVESQIDVLALHHPRKAQADNKKPRQLADVYGSRWLTAGCGSVLLLWGEAGDPIVELQHLKQPADTVGPLTLLHDNQRGTTSVVDTNDVVRIVAAQTTPTTVADVARVLFSKQDPSDNEIEKARRRLESATRDKRLERIPPPPGGAVTYRVTEKGHGGSR